MKATAQIFFYFISNKVEISPELHPRVYLWKFSGISTYRARHAQPYDSSDFGLLNDAHSCHFFAREAYFHALFLPIISFRIWITAIIIQLPFGNGLIAVNLWVALEGFAHRKVTSLSFGIMYCWVRAKAPEYSVYFYGHMAVVEAPLWNADVLTMCALCMLRDKALSSAWGIIPASHSMLPHDLITHLNIVM